MAEGESSPLIIRCKFCNGPTVPFVTPFARYRLCTECGERWTVGEPRPPITIREASYVGNVDDAMNEPVKLQYDDNERIRNLGG